MNEPLNVLEELSIILIGLRMNILGSEFLVDFVELTIQKENHPDYLFIDITLSSNNKNEIIKKLGLFIKSNQNQVDTNKILSLINKLHDNEVFDLESTIMLLYQLSSEFDLGDFVNTEINRLDDQYHLVSNRYVEQTLDELELELKDFLSHFNNPSSKLVILN